MDQIVMNQDDKNFLSYDETLNVIRSLRKVFSFIMELKTSEEMAKHIQFPKIPSKMSESLVYNLIAQKIILPELNFTKSLKGSGDLRLLTADKKIVHLEVKATGRQGFSRLTQGDINADFIIWIHFGNFLTSQSSNTVDIYIVKNLNEKLISPGNITLERFLKIKHTELTHQKYSIVC